MVPQKDELETIFLNEIYEMERQFARKRADFEQNEQSIKIRMSTYILRRLEGLENS